ncbi:MAG: hypothetical protein HN478_22635 [Rhodospirillaceae bacterium]|jgi:predicted hotdog family 3-hydroxylacyl-ACP dehydratase|nr:hypothetical protein [Rhodospirillaceae bacterium]MBT5191142.1 hypothetical protein [Rhodospirillaceae bacterium]MBT5877566.1 hypothetical protein [Rhodospirillaceae bacterium]MBT6426545.1 hypothetical protein [Rhodospirillaceae bacterium]
MMSPVPWPLVEVLPIGEPMILLSGLDTWSEEAVSVFVEIDDDSLFLEEEGVPMQIGIEYMAQACAAYAGCKARSTGGRPGVGFLLGTRNFQSTRAFFRRGARLHVIASVEYQDDAMSMFTCKIDIAGDTVATARISAYQPSDGSLPDALSDG